MWVTCVCYLCVCLSVCVFHAYVCITCVYAIVSLQLAGFGEGLDADSAVEVARPAGAGGGASLVRALVFLQGQHVRVTLTRLSLSHTHTHTHTHSVIPDVS